MTIPLRLGILNNKDDAGNNDKIPACGFGDGGKWTPVIPEIPIIPGVNTPYVGYWRLDEDSGTVAIDISENNLPMDYIRDFELDKWNAPYFDGSTTYLRGENIALYDSTSQISIVVYYKVDNPPNPHSALVSKYIPASSNVAEAISWGVFLMADGKLQMAVNGGQSVISVNTFFTEGTTYKVVFTYDGTTTKLYVNDVEEATTGSMTGFVDKETSHINIGRREDGNGYFKGWIRDVIIYRYVLTLEDVIALPLIVIGISAPNMGADGQAYRDAISAITYDYTHFGMDDGFVRYSSLGIPGTISWYGLSTFKSDAIAGQAPLFVAANKTTGVIHGAMYLTYLMQDSFTINMWCYMSSWPSETNSGITDKKATLYIDYKINYEPGGMITIFAPGVWGNTAKLKFIAPTEAGPITVYATLPTNIAINNWFMITCLANNTTGETDIYINGQLSTLIQGAFTPGTLSINDFIGYNSRIGMRSPANNTVPEAFDGYLDEITLVAGALSDSEILNIYNKGNH